MRLKSPKFTSVQIFTEIPSDQTTMQEKTAATRVVAIDSATSRCEDDKRTCGNLHRLSPNFVFIRLSQNCAMARMRNSNFDLTVFSRCHYRFSSCVYSQKGVVLFIDNRRVKTWLFLWLQQILVIECFFGRLIPTMRCSNSLTNPKAPGFSMMHRWENCLT